MLKSADENLQGNAKFAVAVDGCNEKLQQRKQSIDAARKKVSAFRPKPFPLAAVPVAVPLQVHLRPLTNKPAQHGQVSKSQVHAFILVRNLLQSLGKGERSWSGMQGEATVPSTLGDEFDTNPFLRPSDPRIRKHLGAKKPLVESCNLLPLLANDGKKFTAPQLCNLSHSVSMQSAMASLLPKLSCSALQAISVHTFSD